MSEPACSSAPSGPGLILQICPNDRPPFRDICAAYEAAAESIGCRMVTVFLSPTRGVPLPSAVYLNVDDHYRVRQAAAALSARARDWEGVPVLALCHRYRAYRVMLASALPVGRLITIAHEFGLLGRWQRRLVRRLLARHVLFAGVSPAVQADLASTVPAPLCLPNGIDVARLRRQLVPRQQALATLGLEDGRFTVGVVGRLIPWKRPGLAIDALRLLVQACPDAQLVLIGEGELRPVLEAASVDLPVRFAGFVPDARRCFQALDALLMVSDDREAFGMVALEAMAAGVPVVVGPSPGPRSVVGEVGYCYPRATPAAIAAVLAEVRVAVRDGAADKQTGEGILRCEREYSVSALAARLDDLFFRMS